MTVVAAYQATMADLKTDPSAGGLWNGYTNTMPVSSYHPASIDATAGSHNVGRPRSSMDNAYSYDRYGQHDADPSYDRHQPPHLASAASYPSLKRTYAESQQQHQPPPPTGHHQPQTPYGEMVQDMRDDGSKFGVTQGHKMLCFTRLPDKHSVVDARGCVQQLELSAQLHGMFFLSEMPTSGPDGSVTQAELTCYRRNLFQISGSLITPRSPLSVVGPHTKGEPIPIGSTEVTISAIESVDGNAVRLIVIPWKTPPPNSPEPPQTPDQEPPSLPLIPFQEDAGSVDDADFAVYPLGWRRLQFRIATANNGRRKELQQHFVLHLKVVATLINGDKVVLCEAATAPIVVRGRSPRNFQTRKEIPLLGSSAGSRGQALVESGVGIVPGPLSLKSSDAKARHLSLDMPRSSFTFATNKLPGTAMAMRSNSYPTWPAPQVHLSSMTSPVPPYPPASSLPETYSKVPIGNSNTYGADPNDMALQHSMAPPIVPLSSEHSHQASSTLRPQPYSYPTPNPATTTGRLSIPSSIPPSVSSANSSSDMSRYLSDSVSSTSNANHSTSTLDSSNSHPAKIARTAPSHQSVHSSSSLSNQNGSAATATAGIAAAVDHHNSNVQHTHADYRYASSYPPVPQSQVTNDTSRDYLPAAAQWAPAAPTLGSNGADNTGYAPGPNSRAYAGGYPNYTKTEKDVAHGQTQATSYQNTMNGHYSWTPA